MLAFLIVVVAVDTGAYASGLSFGKHPMAPRISPKKTWEGFAGAVARRARRRASCSRVFMLGEPWWFGVHLRRRDRARPRRSATSPSR